MKLHFLFLLLAAATSARAVDPCRIEIVDRENGWPVPLVELRTTHGARFFSDNAGIVAFDLPEMMGREVWFEVAADGYEVPADPLGFRGVRLTPEPRRTLKIEVDRTSLARRLGRLTGAGLFAESQKTGYDLDAKESGIVGCDSVQQAAHGGRLFWLWGDTTLANYPLGIFHSTAATTEREPIRKFEPPLRVDFDYFTDEIGRPRAVATMPGDGPTWLTGMVSLPDKTGTPRLVATYMKVKALDDIREWGLCVWDEAKREFVPERVLWTKSPDASGPPPLPAGHATFWKDREGKEWLLFGHPFPSLKCPPTFEAWASPETWDHLDPPHELRAGDGSGAVKPHDGPHSGSIAWNPFRNRWITIFQQDGGSPSPLGEIWYAEAESPLGPWGPAVKVLSHRNHTFYNVRLHPELADVEAPFVLFEGTYTAMFAPGAEPTPRHDYNQVLYRLDLDDPALLAPLAANAMMPTLLQTEFLENPPALDNQHPRFSWIVDDATGGAKQTAFHVQAASSPGKLAKGEADFWDSGKVASEKSHLVGYAGQPLSSRQRVWWRVKSQDQQEDMRQVGCRPPGIIGACPLCHRTVPGALAQFHGGRIEWDSAAMKITNRPELNAFIKEPMPGNSESGRDLLDAQ